MGAIQRRGPEDRNPLPVTALVERGLMSEETYRRMPEADKTAQVYVHFSGSPTEPQLVELTMESNILVEPHAHGADEIIFVKEGSIRLGSVDCPAGSSVLIPKNTLYSFRVGPQGVTFLNFRPVGDYAHYSKEEFLARRRTAAGREVPSSAVTPGHEGQP